MKLKLYNIKSNCKLNPIDTSNFKLFALKLDVFENDL